MMKQCCIVHGLKVLSCSLNIASPYASLKSIYDSPVSCTCVAIYDPAGALWNMVLIPDKMHCYSLEDSNLCQYLSCIIA